MGNDRKGACRGGTEWEEKGQYGLMLMWLFRPHRGPRDLLPRVAANGSKAEFAAGAGPQLSDDECWQAIYEEYCRWRATAVDEVATSCQQRIADGACRPAFDTPDWWACLIAEKLRNWDALTRKHHVLATPGFHGKKIH